MSTIINATTTNGVVIQPDNSGSLVLQTNSGTTALTIDTSQRAAFVAGTAALPAITTTGDTNTGIFFSAADTIDFAEGGAAVGQFDSSANFKFNSGYGSVATAYGCRAWANFNGQSGASPVIRASGNISSITRVSTGKYTVAFTNALSDSNYSITTSTSRNYNNFLQIGDGGEAPSTTQFTLYSADGSNNLADCLYGIFAVFR